MKQWFDLKKVTVRENPGQLVTAATRDCSLCCSTIDGMGGPGYGSLCVRCGNAIRAGQFRGLIQRNEKGRIIKDG